MKLVCVATVGLPNLLSEIVSHTLDAQKNMTLSASFEFLSQAEQKLAGIDVLITSMEDSQSEVIDEFLFRHPTSVIINLSDSARTGEMMKVEINRFEFDDLSPKGLIQAIEMGVSKNE
ncbi:hypothetical protein [Aliikangiella coralliicola]|uniref:Uncharacterized protein n=1 Tax=Aliikangiella coralliicola TaxID=2592383 RepID=A0A545UEC0_9GAMM|nr:hypothetical protein [Aliikangiella coralliicola]TQV87775.1 hypothetical protein FLL46_10335 [Aliikangiella coralliicola]